MLLQRPSAPAVLATHAKVGKVDAELGVLALGYLGRMALCLLVALVKIADVIVQSTGIEVVVECRYAES